MRKITSYTDRLRAVCLFGGVQGLNILIGLIRNKIAAVLLGPEGIGLMALYNSTLKLLNDSTGFGVSVSGVKSISETLDTNNISTLNESITLVRTWSLLLGLFGMILCVVISPLLSQFTFWCNGYIINFIILSPIILFVAVINGELAVLKGLRRLKSLAKISVYNVIASLIVSVPLYYLFHIKGIIPALLLMTLSQIVIVISYSYRVHPLQLKFTWGTLVRGSSMIRIGIAFVFAGVLGAGTDYAVRVYLNSYAGVSTVGLFNAGYMLVMTYVGMLFAALETDYFPRLSGLNNLQFSFNQTINKQIEITILSSSPFLLAFLIFLPIILPLLYSGKFMPALAMIQIMLLGMYFRAMSLPVQYIPLSKGDSKSYLLLEAIYDIIVLCLVIVFYMIWGLKGIGCGIALASAIDAIVVLTYARFKYKYKLSNYIYIYIAIQFTIALIAFVLVLCCNGVIYWIIGIFLFIVSLSYSLWIIKKSTNLFSTLIARLTKNIVNRKCPK